MTRGRRRKAHGPLHIATLCSTAALLALGGGAGCGGAKDSTLVIVVTASGSPPPLFALDVSLASSAGVSTRRYAGPGGAALALPTTLAAQLPGRVDGYVTIEVTALDAAGAPAARGHEGPVPLRAGANQTAYVRLECNGAVCAGAASDGGTPSDGGDAGAPPDGRNWTCGNGRIDRGETCDTAIPAGQPGACPARGCSDGIPCTEDIARGDGCTASCAHTVVAAFTAGDGCCPQDGTPALDPDCSATCGNGTIEPGETCDRQIAPGQGGACPQAPDCDDGDPCTRDQLISGGTCAAQCAHTPIVASSGDAGDAGDGRDGCCPIGAAHADDADCPIACGNGLLEAGELCDTGAAPPAIGACPAGCDDGDPCTRDVVLGQGCGATCANVRITTFAPGDGCCPAGGNRNADNDCPTTCGNGALEAGETCDRALASGPAACPTSCPPPSACVRRKLLGDAAHCNARCTTELVTTCSTAPDGCCPAGCAAPADPDCSPTCGDGRVDAAGNETCDTALPAGSAGACPQSCPACTHLLIGAGTCQAQCLFLPVTDFRAGDGCCPAGGTFDLDADCAAACGNGVAEPPFEICDSPTAPETCAAACPADSACTTYQLVGSAGGCDRRCVAATIALCHDGDGCCPPGCASPTDDDCASVCGNALVEAGERCDKAITAGKPGACDRSCDDLDPCTADFSSGTIEGCSRACTHVPITACAGGDRCCPRGCSLANDRDCAGACGDHQVTQGETCDPAETCPVACPDDGDRCTIDRLIGDPLRCTSACVHTPITACSGTKVDLCCPTGCDPRSDIDC